MNVGLRNSREQIMTCHNFIIYGYDIFNFCLCRDFRSTTINIEFDRKTSDHYYYTAIVFSGFLFYSRKNKIKYIVQPVHATQNSVRMYPVVHSPRFSHFHFVAFDNLNGLRSDKIQNLIRELQLLRRKSRNVQYLVVYTRGTAVITNQPRTLDKIHSTERHINHTYCVANTVG